MRIAKAAEFLKQKLNTGPRSAYALHGLGGAATYLVLQRSFKRRSNETANNLKVERQAVAAPVIAERVGRTGRTGLFTPPLGFSPADRVSLVTDWNRPHPAR